MNLQLHRVQFLNVEAVECIVSSLPNLETLGIYQCPLLHLGTTGRLLDIVEAYKKRSGFIHLDFFPTFHQGPNASNRKGSFGVTWTDPGINTAAGIVKLILYEYYPKARRLGFDLFDDAGAFRFWLEKCPLPDWTVVRVNEAIKTYERDRALKSSAEMWMQDGKDRAFKRLADEVAAAIFTDDTEPGIVPQRVMTEILAVRRKGEALAGDQFRDYNWWRAQSNECRTCTQATSILSSFFPYGNYNSCYGCRLMNVLNLQDDHMKSWLKRSMARWLGDKSKKFHHRTIADALASDTWKDGTHFAYRTDTAFKFERDHPHDSSTKDLVWHLDYISLERRWRRDREPHGGIDRRRDDRQYIPVGEENFGVSLNLVEPEFFFVEMFSDEKEALVASRVSRRPEANHYSEDRFRREVFKLQCVNVSQMIKRNSEDAIAAKVESQGARDRQLMLVRHRLWQSLVRRPNRPAMNWDEMREYVLLEIEKKANGGRLLNPKADIRQWTDTVHKPV